MRAVICGVLSLLFFTTTHATDATKAPYAFGVFPYLPALQLERLYAPIGANFGRVLARDIRFHTSSSFALFADHLRRQTYHIAFVQPFFYAAIARDAGYLPLARLDVALAAIFVTTQDSPLRHLQDLRGTTLALPPVRAAVSHLAKIAMLQNGLHPERDVTLHHLPSHTACLHQLLAKTAHACVTAASPLRIFQEQRQISLRVFTKTQSIPSALFVAHASVPVQQRAVLQQTIVSWHRSASGRHLLKQTRIARFVPASDAEYDVVRRYWKEIVKTCSPDCL